MYQNIWATFARKIVTKKIKKSPNLVTLIAYLNEAYAYHEGNQPTLLPN